jgi:hypothetical protein
MRIIISPAKQMREDTDSFACSGLPVFMEKTQVLMHWIQGLSYEEQKKLGKDPVFVASDIGLSDKLVMTWKTQSEKKSGKRRKKKKNASQA